MLPLHNRRCRRPAKLHPRRSSYDGRRQPENSLITVGYCLTPAAGAHCAAQHHHQRQRQQHRTALTASRAGRKSAVEPSRSQNMVTKVQSSGVEWSGVEWSGVEVSVQFICPSQASVCQYRRGCQISSQLELFPSVCLSVCLSVCTSKVQYFVRGASC